MKSASILFQKTGGDKGSDTGATEMEQTLWEGLSVPLASLPGAVPSVFNTEQVKDENKEPVPYSLGLD